MGSVNDGSEVPSFTANTVQLSITTDWAKVLSSGGSLRCFGRHLFQRDIFRLITRGLMRLRRGGIRSQPISQSNVVYHSRNLRLSLGSHSGRRVLRI